MNRPEMRVQKYIHIYEQLTKKKKKMATQVERIVCTANDAGKKKRYP